MIRYAVTVGLLYLAPARQWSEDRADAYLFDSALEAHSMRETWVRHSPLLADAVTVRALLD